MQAFQPEGIYSWKIHTLTISPYRSGGALIPSFIKDMQSWYESERVGKREYPVWSYDSYVYHKAKGWVEKVNFN